MIYLASLCFIKIDPVTKVFLDKHGRQITLHGVNAVTKMFPYLPNITGSWDYEHSIIEKDIQFLKNNGMNVVRLGVQWPGVFPQRDTVNKTYLQEVEKLINKLGANGIYTMVDMHQDVFSEYFCGEGVPDWASPYERKGVLNFGRPLLKEFTRDNTTKKIDLETCLKTNFGVYYETAIVGNMFECLYNETCNPFAPHKGEGQPTKQLILQQEFAHFWGNVSAYFVKNEYVMGYDIINEPIAGNLWEHPLNYVITDRTERDYLQPFYRNIMKRIYEQDKNHIIFFEPVVSSIRRAGFDVGGPGASIGIPSDNQGYAWHLYCMTVDENGDPIQPKILCDAQYEFWYRQRNNSGHYLQLTQFIDEFGATADDEISRHSLSLQLQLFSRDAHSWAYWQYKPFGDITTCFNSQENRNEGFYNKDGSLQREKVKLITHPYPQFTAGQLQSSLFDFELKTLFLKYKTGEVGLETTITVGELWKSWGTQIDILVGRGAIKMKQVDNQIIITNVKANVQVELILI